LAPEHTILAAAKRLAIEKARGEWLAFLDCDDLWFPRRLEKQVAIIRAEGPELGLVYGGAEVFIQEDAKQTPIGKSSLANQFRYAKDFLPEGRIFEDLIQDNFVPQPSVMVRFAAYQQVGGVNPDFKHSWDFDLWVKVSKEFKVRALQEVCCIYRVHGANLSHVQMDQCFDENITIVGRYLPSPDAKRAIRGYYTASAAYKMRQGKWRIGLIKLFKQGGFIVFARKFLVFYWRRLRSGVFCS
jgi:glycosyltransferase involved in cell wall biosynthesis